MEIYESSVRVIHGSLVLLDYGDPLTTPGIVIDGQHVIEPVHYMKALSMAHIKRGGETHTLQWTVADPQSGMAQAIKSSLDHAVSVPRSVELVTLQLQTGEQWRLESGAIQSWASDSNEGEGIVASRSYSAVTGSITAMHDVDPLMNWEQQETLWENA